MRSKLKNVRAALSDCADTYGIFVLTETWLKPDVSDNEIFNDSWIVYRCDRASTTIQKNEGGGVLIAVSKSLSSSLIPTSCVGVEQLWVKISFGGSSLLLGGVYLPPDALTERYSEFMEEARVMCETIECDSVMVMGDFNLPDISWSTDDENDTVLLPSNVVSDKDVIVLDGMNSLGLAQICGIRCRNQLDLIFTNIFDDLVVAESVRELKPTSAHHCPIQVGWLISNSPLVTPRVEVFDFAKTDVISLRSALQSTDWAMLLCNELDDNALCFNRFILSLFEEFVPKRIVKSYNCPWMNSTLAHIRNQRNKAHKDYTSCPTTENHE